MANKSNVVTIDAVANASVIAEANAQAEKANAEETARFEAGRKAWLEANAELGANKSKAATSAFEQAMAFQQAIRDGFAEPVVADAKLAVQAFRDGKLSADKAATYGNLGVDEEAKALASLQTAASNLLTFATPCAMANPVALYTAIDASVAGYKAADITGSKIRCYEKVNRELHKLYEKLGSVEEVFKASSGDALSQWLIRKGAQPVGDGSEGDGDGANGNKPEKKQTSPHDKLAAAIKTLDALAAEYADEREFINAVADLKAFYFKKGFTDAKTKRAA
jgi:hypothetical protein